MFAVTANSKISCQFEQKLSKMCQTARLKISTAKQCQKCQKICETDKPKFLLPNGSLKCQFRVTWHFKMPVGNAAMASKMQTKA